MHNSDNTPTVDLIQAIMQNMRSNADNWESFAIVIESSENRFNKTYGCTYLADGTTSNAALSPLSIVPFIDAYMQSVYKRGDKLPIKLLVQYSRKSGEYAITYEDSDATRWAVTPANFNTIIEELRPDF